MVNNLTWVLVTDGAHARTFQRDNFSTPLYPLKDLTHTHELNNKHGHDKPGRCFESGTTARHAYEPKTDWHEHQKEIFSHELIDLFIHEHQEKKFKKAYVVCSPKVMGFLRPHLITYVNKLPPADKIRIVELTKDLTHHPLEVIQEALNSL